MATYRFKLARTDPGAEKHFAGMVERCREYGFDLVNSRVEVSPSSHYHMGGIKIDVNCHTNIDGLFAGGEDAGGVHGANRLGGNGVADSIVFGARAGDTMADYIARHPTPPKSAGAGDLLAVDAAVRAPHRRKPLPPPRPPRTHHVDQSRRGPQRPGHAARPPRNPRNPRKNKRRLLRHLTPDTRHLLSSPIYNAPWNEAIDTENLFLIAEMLTRSALAREESRGAHYRSDFPAQDIRWLKNICMKVLAGGDFEMTFTPVNFTHLTPEELKDKRERAGLKTLPAIDDE